MKLFTYLPTCKGLLLLLEVSILYKKNFLSLCLSCFEIPNKPEEPPIKNVLDQPHTMGKFGVLIDLVVYITTHFFNKLPRTNKLHN